MVAAAQGVKQILIKLGTQAVAGLFSGGASYLVSAGIKGTEISFEDCLKSMCVGGMTGMLTCPCSLPLENISTKANWLSISLQVLGGAFSGAGSYLLAIAIMGEEFNLQALNYDNHRKISAYYSSKQDFTNGQTVRQWLSQFSYEVQYEYGLKFLEQVCGIHWN